MVLMQQNDDIRAEQLFPDVQTMIGPDGKSFRTETELSMWFQTIPIEVLTAIVNGMVNAKVAASTELVMRGMSPTTGKWIGFDEAMREALAL